MNTRLTASEDGSMTIRIPLTFRKRGGRKMVVTPDGAAWAPRPRVRPLTLWSVYRSSPESMSG